MFTVAVLGFCPTESHQIFSIAVVDLIGKAHQRGWACSDYSSDATEYREVGHFVRFRARTGQASFNALALKA